MAGFFAGLGASTTFDEGSECAGVFGDGAVEAERDDVVGSSTLTLFGSLRFGSCAAFTGAAALTETAALTGLRAVAGLRAAVLVVVFVGICVPEKFWVTPGH